MDSLSVAASSSSVNPQKIEQKSSHRGDIYTFKIIKIGLRSSENGLFECPFVFTPKKMDRHEVAPLPLKEPRLAISPSEKKMTFFSKLCRIIFPQENFLSNFFFETNFFHFFF